MFVCLFVCLFNVFNKAEQAIHITDHLSCYYGFGIIPAQYVVLLVITVVGVTIYFTNKNIIGCSKDNTSNKIGYVAIVFLIRYINVRENRMSKQQCTI